MWRDFSLIFLARTVQSEVERKTAGAVFVPERLVIIVSGLETTWVIVLIPGLPAINVTHLDLVY